MVVLDGMAEYAEDMRSVAEASSTSALLQEEDEEEVASVKLTLIFFIRHTEGKGFPSLSVQCFLIMKDKLD